MIKTDIVRNLSSYEKLLRDISKNISPIVMNNLNINLFNEIIKLLNDKVDENICIITKNNKELNELNELLNMIGVEVIKLDERITNFFESTAYSRSHYMKRTKSISEIILNNKRENDKKVILISMTSIINRHIKKDVFERFVFEIKKGDSVESFDVKKRLINLGYVKNYDIEEIGHFSDRGFILDIFSPNYEFPLRIEFFDDYIEEIRFFDLKQKTTIKKVDKILIFPVNEMPIDFDKVSTSEIFSKDKENELINNIRDNIENKIHMDEYYKYISLFYKEYDFIIDYIKNPLVIIKSFNETMDELKKYYEAFFMEYNQYLGKNYILEEVRDSIFEYDDVLKMLSSKKLIYVDEYVSNIKSKSIVDFNSSNLSMYQGKLDLLKEDLIYYIKNKYEIHIVVKEKFIPVLKNLLSDEYFKDIKIHEGNANGGFVLLDKKIILLTINEIFNKKIKRVRRKKSLHENISSFRELKIGDLVVHENHGIGEYQGINQLDFSGDKKDYLKIKYKGDDSLYVPIEQLDFIQRYVGKDKDIVRIDSLDSVRWVNAKNRALKNISDITDELIEIYSNRASSKGFSFSKDDILQMSFEEKFEYEETEGQLRAIEEIKKDMESDTPMDRLLLGDVGFGKTEVALRAAFKAINDNKQVVFLVPTTVLAQQHYNKIVERFKDFPINIEMLSRFRTQTQVKKIQENLRLGIIDMIISTHKILNDKIIFKDLGLLIVDEEQRFGVKQKEKIKELYPSVDILSLSATPIPRTFNMAISSIRDLSELDEAPIDRLPVNLFVIPKDEFIINEAIKRELNRGGQVFYVHNRINDIYSVYNEINKNFDDKKIAVAHSKIPTKELEKIMIDFYEKKYDILLTTTIIENGVDFANVNTMIINDADKLGLSQLYQLKGRIGRSNKRAYAYLVYQRNKILKDKAKKRIEAIKNFTELNSGAKIAMADMKIRGAGGLLSSMQHGHIIDIGYELYIKMLEREVKIKKGFEVKNDIEVTIDLKISAYIPNTYIVDEKIKLEIYKKISGIRNLSDKEQIILELEDRFGEIPNVVDNLLEISYIKSIAQKINLYHIIEKEDYILFKFNKNMDIDLINIFIKKYKQKIKFKMKDDLFVYYSYNGSKINKKQVLEEIKNLLDNIVK